MIKFFLVLICAALAVVLLTYGTVSPCVIVRVQVLQQAAREGGFGVIASALPDGIIDSIITSQYGSLSPGRCIAIAMQGSPLHSEASRQQASTSITKPQATHQAG